MLKTVAIAAISLILADLAVAQQDSVRTGPRVTTFTSPLNPADPNFPTAPPSGGTATGIVFSHAAQQGTYWRNSTAAPMMFVGTLNPYKVYQVTVLGQAAYSFGVTDSNSFGSVAFSVGAGEMLYWVRADTGEQALRVSALGAGTNANSLERGNVESLSQRNYSNNGFCQNWEEWLDIRFPSGVHSAFSAYRTSGTCN